MVVKVDATGTALITTVAGASVNYTGITVGTGVDRALVVTVACAAAVTAPNAHWDTAGANQAMTLITAVETATNVTTFMFGLRNPVAGAKTLNVAWTTSAKSNIEAISFTDVDQTSDAKAFINANFVKDGATVSSILMGLVSPADSIAVASYGTSATFSSLTGTNLFTDTTNTGCEGAASRSNGAGATINFTGADTSTAGNKVMVGFVVAPVITVLSTPWEGPVLPKPGLPAREHQFLAFTAPAKEDIAKVDCRYAPWLEPVRTTSKFTPDQQSSAFLALVPAASTAIVASEDGSSGPVFKWRLIYKAKTEPIATVKVSIGWFSPLSEPVRVIASPAKQQVLALAPNPIVATGWSVPLSEPARAKQRAIADYAYAPLSVSEVITIDKWYNPLAPPVLSRRQAADFKPWSFVEPPPQVFFSYAPWDDFARRKQPPLDTQPLAWSSTQFATVVPTMAWTNWPDFATKARRPTDAPSLAFLALTPSATVIGDWDDFARRKQPPLDTQPLAWAPQTTVAAVPTWTTWTPWPDLVPTQKKPVADLRPWTFLEPPPQVFFPYAPWDNFARKPKPLVDIRPWTFVPPPKQVFFPYGPWDDFARKKPQPLDTQPLDWSGFTPVPPVSTAIVAGENGSSGPIFKHRLIYRSKTEPVAVPPPTAVVIVPSEEGGGPTFLWQLTYQDSTEPVFVPITTVPVMAWVRWPDFAERRQQPPTDPQSFVFTPEPSYATVVHDWADFARSKPQPLDTQPLIWAPQTIAAAAPTMPWVRWPDSVPAARRTVEFQPFEFVALPPTAAVIADWPDFARRKPQLPDTQFLSWGAFTPAPAAAFFLVPDRWPDFATKKRPLNYDPLAFLQTVTSPFNSFVNWPDFATKKKPAADFIPWTFIPSPKQVFFPYGPWDDFARRGRPLNYDPLAFLQTVRTPWVTMTTWPDFAPIRGKIGLHPAEQQFTARFPGTLFGATVTVTMSAFEVNTDGAAAAILVVQSQPAVDAAVAIKEIGILGGSVTP